MTKSYQTPKIARNGLLKLGFQSFYIQKELGRWFFIDQFNEKTSCKSKVDAITQIVKKAELEVAQMIQSDERIDFCWEVSHPIELGLDEYELIRQGECFKLYGKKIDSRCTYLVLSEKWGLFKIF
jgi:hypothetical protein